MFYRESFAFAIDIVGINKKMSVQTVLINYLSYRNVVHFKIYYQKVEHSNEKKSWT